ncbi:HET-domain-containing protein, partial [Glonium stellatum]
MVQQYQHVPLQDPRSVRVIRLDPASNRTEPLCCTLEEVSLDASPEYTALSYSWDAQKPSCPIGCRRGTLYITPNCVSALRQLRDEHGVQTLWIDSICIDQTSLEERSSQVALMGEIYKKAKEVIVWLGESDSSTKQAIQCLSDISQIGGEMDVESKERAMRLLFGLEAKSESEDPIGPLFRRSWFHRMWTIQEVTL